jgi:hypothetical protein
MRVKVRFNVEAQAPVILDLRFLPRIGERIDLGFRRVIEVLEVHRVENDNRLGGIIRAKYIQMERRPPPPVPAPMPFPPISIPSLAVEAKPAPAPVKTGTASVYADVSLDELDAALRGGAMVPNPAV